MPNMGRYCKAYPIKSLREFAGWTENVANARPAEAGEDETDGAGPRVLTEDDFLYLQENYVVTDGIFIDENIIFESSTPEWIDFCRNALAFEVPEYARASAATAGAESVVAADS
jgi:hypothetical protein